MIAVVVRQDDQIYRWQVGDLARRLHLAPGPDPVTQIDVLAFVQESGIGQDGQPAETDQCGGVTDEVNIALTEFCRPTPGQLQGSHRVLSLRWGFLTIVSLFSGTGLGCRSSSLGQIVRTG